MSKTTKVIGAKVPETLYGILLAEAEENGKSVSDYLRQIVTDRHKYDNLLTDFEAIVAGSNAELSEAIGITIRQELRQYREEFKAQHEQLKGVITVCNNLGAGINKLLGIAPEEEQIKAVMAYGTSHAKAVELLGAHTFNEAITALKDRAAKKEKLLKGGGE